MPNAAAFWCGLPGAQFGLHAQALGLPAAAHRGRLQRLETLATRGVPGVLKGTFSRAEWGELSLHLMDGVIDSGPVLLGGAALAAAGVGIGLWRMDEEKIPQTGVMAAAFFLISLIHVPIPPGSAHLTLAGLAGLLLGWSVFPAVLVGLLLQAVLFGIGGWTTLGINTITFALPGVACYYLFAYPLQRQQKPGPVFLTGFGVGATGTVLSCCCFSVALLLSGREFFTTVYLVAAAHLPILVVEGMVTGTIVVSLKRLRPQVFEPVMLGRAKEYAGG